MNSAFRVERAAPSHRSMLQELFQGAASGCFCQWWHFEGDKNDWQLRCAEQEQNCDQMHSQLQAGSPHMSGFVAVQGARAVGWLKLSPAPEMSKLYQQRLYRDLPCFSGDRRGVLTVGCMLVDRDAQRQGIARALLHGAIDWAKHQGARAVEAFPRRGQQLHPADLWLGPAALYAELGFSEVHTFDPYPVLRLNLES